MGRQNRYEHSNYLSGPKFKKFLEDHNVQEVELVGRNRFDQHVTVWRADRILTHLGMHLWQIPHDVWMPVGYHPYRKRNEKLKAGYLAK